MQAKRLNKQEIKPQRGRPKLSHLSQTELAKLRMREMRNRKRNRQNLVPIEVWIPKSQRDLLLKNGYDLSAAATKAFELFIKRQR
jgi:hypothetical protein